MCARSRAVAALMVGCLSAASGCSLRGDPGWALAIQNESAREVVVAIDEAGGRRVVYSVAPRAAGYAYGTLGVGHRRASLLDRTCAVLQAIDTPDSGNLKLTIAADGRAEVGLTAESGLPHLSPQAICGGVVT